MAPKHRDKCEERAQQARVLECELNVAQRRTGYEPSHLIPPQRRLAHRAPRARERAAQQLERKHAPGEVAADDASLEEARRRVRECAARDKQLVCAAVRLWLGFELARRST